MSGIRSIIVYGSILLIGCQLTLAANETASNSNATTGAPPGMSKAQERISIYESSIRYWDTQNPEVKRTILKDLASGEEPNPTPGCPRIRFPLICDSDGSVLENACYFRMRRRERSTILPLMVFTSTPIEQAKIMCENEIRKNKPTQF